VVRRFTISFCRFDHFVLDADRTEPARKNLHGAYVTPDHSEAGLSFIGGS
jgi:hypothetical protein